MAGEYDEKFDKIESLLNKSIGGLDELRLEVRDMRKELRENVSEVKLANRKLDVLSGQFTDVVRKFIKDHKRIDGIENRVEQLENPVR